MIVTTHIRCLHWVVAVRYLYGVAAGIGIESAGMDCAQVRPGSSLTGTVAPVDHITAQGFLLVEFCP